MSQPEKASHQRFKMATDKNTSYMFKFMNYNETKNPNCTQLEDTNESTHYSKNW